MADALNTLASIEAKLHGESSVIQRCFDDNNDDKKKMMTKVMTKTSKVNQRMSSRYSRRNQGEFKTQEESLESRIKTQDLKNQDQDSRLKIQESRKDSIKISTKKFFKTLSST